MISAEYTEQVRLAHKTRAAYMRGDISEEEALAILEKLPYETQLAILFLEGAQSK